MGIGKEKSGRSGRHVVYLDLGTNNNTLQPWTQWTSLLEHDFREVTYCWALCDLEAYRSEVTILL